MCISCVIRTEGPAAAAELRHRIARGLKCGKSKSSFNADLHQGCPSGKRSCGMCGIPNGGKSSRKGKGKDRRYNGPSIPRAAALSHGPRHRGRIKAKALIATCAMLPGFRCQSSPQRIGGQAAPHFRPLSFAPSSHRAHPLRNSKFQRSVWQFRWVLVECHLPMFSVGAP